MFTEKPAMFRKTNAPMRVTGMTTAGPTAARKFWRKTSTTSMTSTMDFTQVRYTCVTAMETKCDVSNGIESSACRAGQSLDSFSWRLRMLAAGFKGVGVGQLVDGDERRVGPRGLWDCAPSDCAPISISPTSRSADYLGCRAAS